MKYATKGELGLIAIILFFGFAYICLEIADVVGKLTNRIEKLEQGCK